MNPRDTTPPDGRPPGDTHPPDGDVVPERNADRAEAESAPSISDAEFRTRSRRAFLVGTASAAAGALGWRWLRTGPEDGNIPHLLRDGHELNEELWRGLYSPDRLAPTFPVSRARMPKTNGGHGLMSPLDPGTWSLRVEGPDGRLLALLDLDDVRRLPRVEMTTELKCIEGWSEVVHWAGARFSDFARVYARVLPADAWPYAFLATPDMGYYVGMDRASMLHPQTLLCYEMQGAPLTVPHGAPLRLATPLKYGVKSIKRIGLVRFAAARPPDFWAERGYDWYIGH